MAPNEPPPSNADPLSGIIDNANSNDERPHEALVNALYDRPPTPPARRRQAFGADDDVRVH